jgi:hypothetical protein
MRGSQRDLNSARQRIGLLYTFCDSRAADRQRYFRAESIGSCYRELSSVYGQKNLNPTNPLKG